MIHAGTHKTASSYIQSRMAANRSQLEKAGVLVRYPAASGGKHRSMASALARAEWPIWQGFLRDLPATGSLVLMSAEHFAQPLASRQSRQPLVELLAAEGFGLHVLLFLRDQPDYINARYVHSTRRLYHHMSFESYVADQLAHRSHIYDYNSLFSDLLSEPAVSYCFLPYGSCFGDPFERMLTSLGCDEPEDGWRPADPRKANVQPGCQGVWLAQAIGERLGQLGVQGQSLVKAGRVMNGIAEQQGWQYDRYCGFDPAGAAAVAAHYAQANDAFARQVWGCSWRERVPELPMQRRCFDPAAADLQSHQKDVLVEQSLKELALYNPGLKAILGTSALR